jgi:two-component system, OmpR family, copper resistance phosphate regulon response regulator CusR
MRILLVEDDLRVGQYLEEALVSAGYSVLWVKTYGEAEIVLKIANEDFSLAILDRMVSGFDAAQLISPIKKRFPQIGILILSAIDAPSEKAKWLDLGADEYMGKPFALEELTVRLRNLLRNKTANTNLDKVPHLSIGDLLVDLLSHQVMCKGKRLDFTKKEYQLMILLIEKPGRVFDKFQILDRVWSMDSQTDSNVVEVTIRNIRRKLEDSSSNVLISSRRNMGYWIET